MADLGKIGDQVVQSALTGARVEVETTLWPKPFVVDLTPTSEPPGLLKRLLRPKVTLRRGDLVVGPYAPAGEPRDVPLLAIVALAAILLVTLLRGLR